MLDAWQVQTERSLDELVSRVWGERGLTRRCVLKAATREVPIDVVEVRIVPKHLERGWVQPARGTLTVDVRSDHTWHALKQLARAKAAVVLQRPDGGVLAMQFDGSVTASTQKLAAGAPTRPVAIFTWHSP